MPEDEEEESEAMEVVLEKATKTSGCNLKNEISPSPRSSGSLINPSLLTSYKNDTNGDDVKKEDRRKNDNEEQYSNHPSRHHQKSSFLAHSRRSSTSVQRDSERRDAKLHWGSITENTRRNKIVGETVSRREVATITIPTSKSSYLSRSLPQSFLEFANDKLELRLELIKKNMAKKKHKLIGAGCCFDAIHGFLFCGATKVYKCKENGSSIKSVIKGLQNPSSISIIGEGLLVVLDDNCLAIYEIKTGTLVNKLMEAMAKKGRGLAVTENRKICVFIAEDDDSCSMNIFDFEKRTRDKIPYEHGFPRSVCSSNNMIFATDSESNMIVIDAKDSRGVYESRVISLTDPGTNTLFSCAAGITADSKGEVLVADAQRHMLYWCTANFVSISEVMMGGRIWPAIGQIAVSPNGYVLVSNADEAKLALYRFTPEMEPDDDDDLVVVFEKIQLRPVENVKEEFLQDDSELRLPLQENQSVCKKENLLTHHMEDQIQKLVESMTMRPDSGQDRLVIDERERPTSRIRASIQLPRSSAGNRDFETGYEELDYEEGSEGVIAGDAVPIAFPDVPSSSGSDSGSRTPQRQESPIPSKIKRSSPSVVFKVEAGEISSTTTTKERKRKVRFPQGRILDPHQEEPHSSKRARSRSRSRHRGIKSFMDRGRSRSRTRHASVEAESIRSRGGIRGGRGSRFNTVHRRIEKMTQIIDDEHDTQPCSSRHHRDYSQPQKSSAPSIPYSFSRWSNSAGDLILRQRVNSIASGRVLNPLGCTYHNELGFLFCGIDNILSCREDGSHVRELASGFYHPTAVVAISDDIIAVLDYNALMLIDLITGEGGRTLLKGLHGRARGLAYTSQGLLVTTKKDYGGGHSIVAFNIKKSCALSTLQYPGGVESLPCFLTASGNLVAITDLKGYRLVVVDASVPDDMRVERIVKLDSDRFKNAFSFVSGIVMDQRYEMLIADASSETLNWVTSRVDQLKKVRVVDGKWPYTSAFAVSPNGYVLAAARKGNFMRLFKFETEETWR